jgi:hypothetical protein
MFVQLRALKVKTALEVASHLIEIFSTFGAPEILEFDNGSEFTNKIAIEVVSKCPQCKIVYGKPVHSQFTAFLIYSLLCSSIDVMFSLVNKPRSVDEME